MLELKAPMSGKSIPMAQVPDETFATDVMGKGVAVDPADGLVVAPCDGVVTAIATTLHAVCLAAAGDVEILLHIGIDTVNLKGKGFTCYVQKGQQVKQGEKLMKLDLKRCRKANLSPISPMVVIDPENYELEYTCGDCIAGKTTLITVR